jgi:hypothetical protein
MRYFGTTVGLCVLMLSGCVWHNPFVTPTPPHPPVAAEVPTKEQLVGYLNDNAQRIQTIDCRRDMEMDVKQRLHALNFRLTGYLVCQKQRNFRLQAQYGGNTEVDMGSNQNEFWYWLKRADPPYLVHCSYDDLARGTKMPFPFQPEWIMEALGMANHDASRMTLNVNQNTLELVENGVGAQGQAVRKVIVFNRAQVSPGRAQVSAYLLLDAGGREICAARILDARYDPPSGAVVPQKIVLEWPAENNTELTLKLYGMTVNSNIAPNQALAMFTRPQLSGVQSVDLARGLDRPAGTVQRTGGVFR